MVEWMEIKPKNGKSYMRRRHAGKDHFNYTGGKVPKICVCCKKMFYEYASNLRKTCGDKDCKCQLASSSHKGKTLGVANGVWVGDNVSYSSLHTWVRKNKPKPEFCDVCKKNKPMDLSNISGQYERDISDFEWLCRKCHMVKDGRLAYFKFVGARKEKIRKSETFDLLNKQRIMNNENHKYNSKRRKNGRY